MSVPEVIVFRPEPKASALVDALMACQIPAIAVEPFEIHFVPIEPMRDCYDDIVFSSTYAVDAFFKQHAKSVAMVKNASIWAIGSSTAEMLDERGIKAFYPIKADSEHLLEMFTQMARTLEHRNFLLVKGEGGRDLLTQKLARRVLSLEVLECYSRNAYDKAHLLSQLQRINWGAKLPKILLYTSFDALKMTLSMFEVFPQWQQSCVVTVTNSRMLDWAKRQGFVKLYQLENLTQEQLVIQLSKLR